LKKDNTCRDKPGNLLTAFVFNVITIYWVGSWQKQADPFLMISGGLLLFANPLFFLIPSTLLYFAGRSLPIDR